MKTTVATCFHSEGVMLSLGAIQPIRQVHPRDAAFGKYRAILASIREVGIIEPLVVYPQKNSPGSYFLMDGHLRLRALTELGQTQAYCLVSKDNDTFTYNDKVNRISVIQEYRMIMRALEKGVTQEEIAKVLEVNIEKIKQTAGLLDGIDAEAVEILKNRPISAVALKCFKKVEASRQVDMAQLMVAGNNFTCAYAEALVVGTPRSQLHGKPRKPKGLSWEEAARMEQEMSSLESEYRIHQEQFGENSLHLNAAHRYIKKLLANVKVEKFLSTRYPEIMEEFQEIAALERI